MIEEEWGGNVKFVGDPGAYFQSVTAHDSEGKEIEIPKCERCGWHKSQVIGKYCFGWICTNLDCK